uniref:Uncharacterized protein n=1 Tax=Rhizophora mucronata TaxID=61149 RepID=A0A2P2PS24_RHIMU
MTPGSEHAHGYIPFCFKLIPIFTCHVYAIGY